LEANLVCDRSLCVIGQEPRKFSAEEELLLMTLARLVVREVEIRESLRATLRLEAEGEARKLNANYIGSVAHDIRTPLNSFTLGLQALATTGALNETQQDIVDMMSISAELMNLTVVKAVETSLYERRHPIESCLTGTQDSLHLVECL